MKRFFVAALLAVAPLVAAPLQGMPQTAPQLPPVAIAVRDNGLVATWYPPASGKRGPAIIVLGGSEGGEEGSRRIAEAFAFQGYGVLALAWFRAEGLPQQLQEIPLEYFGTAIAWLEAQPLADRAHIGLYGISKGGEAALLIASRHAEIKAVVAAVPSSVVWQGINFANYADVRSSFSEGGKPVAYLPYDASAPFTGILDLYQRSLKFAGRHPDAVIPVERIGGPVLLLSGRDDKLWPSTEMADQVIARLDAKGFKHLHRHIAYADAGHAGVGPPYGASGAMPPPDAAAASLALGGTEAGNIAARRNAWAQTLAFFDQALGGPSK